MGTSCGSSLGLSDLRFTVFCLEVIERVGEKILGRFVTELYRFTISDLASAPRPVNVK
jgi:hypothetical protein